MFSARDWKNIERARRDYMSWQWTKRQAVEYKHLENRIKNLVRDSNALTKSIRIDKLGVILWTLLSAGENLPFVPSDLHRTLLELERRASLVLKENRRLFESGIGPTTISPWDRLVDTLAAIFRHNNVPTTSTRSSRAKNPRGDIRASNSRYKGCNNSCDGHGQSRGAADLRTRAPLASSP